MRFRVEHKTFETRGKPVRNGILSDPKNLPEAAWRSRCVCLLPKPPGDGIFRLVCAPK